MDASFYKELFNKQQRKQAVPPNKVIAAWALEVIYLLYPELSDGSWSGVKEIEARFEILQKDLISMPLSFPFSCSIRIRSCQTWDYRGLRQKTSQPILPV